MQMVRDIVIHHRAQPMLNFVASFFKDAPDAYALLSRLCTIKVHKTCDLARQTDDSHAGQPSSARISDRHSYLRQMTGSGQKVEATVW